jgi:uncharacterized protein YbbC (DUF1343 family)
MSALLRLAGGFAALFILASCGENNPLAPDATPSTPTDKPRAPAAAGMVKTGIDQVELDNGGILRGRKIGLIAHAASVTGDGRRSVDALRAKDVNVVRIFSPEHGFASTAAAGEKIAVGKDEATKLPVVSLYGDKTRPQAADLAGLDALVFDLQDAGVRFYTYMSTMMLAMDAAAEAGIDFVVLDRPNPLGGERVEGPSSDARGAVPESLVNMTPGPLVHGMTAGEMARFVNAARANPAKLTVIPLRGWRRTMTWSDTGRAWVPPSPNLRTPEAAIAYPGTALVEGTNVSEGRGTDAPFLLVGAPWLKPELLVPVVKVPGFTAEPTTFTPAPSAAAPAPKHAGKASPGLRIKVTDAPGARPYQLGVALLFALRTQPGFEWLREGEAIDRLVGTKKLRAALERGDTVEAIVASDTDAIAAYRKDRLKALLY